MKIYEYSPGQALRTGRCAVAIGFFDGVHLAHRALIGSAVENAKRLGVPAGVFTFSSESAIKPGNPRIYSTEERLSLMKELGVDFAAVCNFSDVAGMSGESFVRQCLAQDVGAVSVTAGFNFRFGRGASSDAEMLCRYMSEAGGEAVIREPYIFEGAPLSSSLIRNFLAVGDIARANAALGAPYFVSGRVTEGNRVGRKLGFPTVNLEEAEGRVKLKHGVYACAAVISGKLYPAAVNVGVCPTFDERKPHYEAHIIDFSEDVYGKDVRLYFLDYLREERRFDSPEELKMQIKVDKNSVKERSLLWQEIGLNLR